MVLVARSDRLVLEGFYIYPLAVLVLFIVVLLCKPIGLRLCFIPLIGKLFRWISLPDVSACLFCGFVAQLLVCFWFYWSISFNGWASRSSAPTSGCSGHLNDDNISFTICLSSYITKACVYVWVIANPCFSFLLCLCKFSFQVSQPSEDIGAETPFQGSSSYRKNPPNTGYFSD